MLVYTDNANTVTMDSLGVMEYVIAIAHGWARVLVVPIADGWARGL
jgi:hypothetical protein